MLTQGSLLHKTAQHPIQQPAMVIPSLQSQIQGQPQSQYQSSRLMFPTDCTNTRKYSGVHEGSGTLGPWNGPERRTRLH